MPPILFFENISKRFGAVVVADGIDLAVEEGEALGIIGPNGAGKTTLFAIASGTVASPRRRCTSAAPSCLSAAGLRPKQTCAPAA
jgi:ABC-type branched-subunit amino acid transport system ATPase component